MGRGLVKLPTDLQIHHVCNLRVTREFEILNLNPLMVGVRFGIEKKKFTGYLYKYQPTYIVYFNYLYFLF